MHEAKSLESALQKHLIIHAARVNFAAMNIYILTLGIVYMGLAFPLFGNLIDYML